jgi:hypothetical protein
MGIIEYKEAEDLYITVPVSRELRLYRGGGTSTVDDDRVPIAPFERGTETDRTMFDGRCA